MNNPILSLDTPPPFKLMQAEHVKSAMQSVLLQASNILDSVEACPQPTYDSVMNPLDQISRLLESSWNSIQHLESARASDELRTAYKEVLNDVVTFDLRLKQSEKIFAALQNIKNSSEWNTLNQAKQRAIMLSIQAAETSGIGLQGEKRVRFNDIMNILSELDQKFSNNVVDSVKAFQLVLTTPEEISGLPESYLNLASQSYNAAFVNTNSTPQNGPWLIQIANHSYITFMEMSPRRDLREKLWRAFSTRASTDEFNNNQFMQQILALRLEAANLLGYKTWAELGLSTKMAKNIESVRTLSTQIKNAAKAHATHELQQIKNTATAQGFTGELMPWDLPYWRTRYMEKELQFNDETLRPYFPVTKVLSGLFSLINKLFDVSMVEATAPNSKWDDSVQYFLVKNTKGEQIASFFLDIYARPSNKRGGAWAMPSLSRRVINNTLEKPVAIICGNFQPPIGNSPALMSFGEVETLFHEMGHALQAMLTTVDVGHVSGLSGIEWDAVELASQFMENWCFEENTLLSISEHFETKQPIPRELLTKIKTKKQFLQGLHLCRQLAFLETDLYLHHEFNPNGTDSPHQIYRNNIKNNYVMEAHPDDKFLCGFTHIFSGGYSAGYYSYLWAQVLSADAYAAFEDVGLNNIPALQKVGIKYRDTILALGGSQHPSEVFAAFRGRAPNAEALLRHSGIPASK